MSIDIRTMVPEDYDAVIELWRASQGVGLSKDDSREGIARHLALNPGLSFVAVEGACTAGAVLGSQDGRRGYLTHLAVAEGYRGRGIGEALIERCLAALRQVGIRKCHIFVYADNGGARSFWAKRGWVQRDELVVMSKVL